MAIPKIKGIETEWSIVVRGKNHYKPASVREFELMINTIRKFFNLPVVSGRRLSGDIENAERVTVFGDENFISEYNDDLLASVSELLKSNQGDKSDDISRRRTPSISHSLLPNGSRFYIDGSHLEYSTPECLLAKTLVAADKAGEAILNLSRIGANKILADRGLRLIIYKDSSDRKGNSYGGHENYLVSREAFKKITDRSLSPEAGYLISYFVVRQIFTGAGKMGVESDGKCREESIYQISQRADFIQEILNNCTIERRAIINLRNEPHADYTRFARLHVIVGDANMSEFSTYLRVGVTSIILKMIEDGFFDRNLILKNPVEGLKLVSFDLTCKKPVLETEEGKKVSALDVNWQFLEMAKNYFSQFCEPSEEERDILSKWEETLMDFSTGNEGRLRRRLDWKIKQDILDNFLKTHNFDWNNLKDAVIRDGSSVHRVTDQLLKKDLLYHDIDKEAGLYRLHKEAGDVDEISKRDEVIALVKSPPDECRSYFRGKCLEKFYSQIEFADWEEIVFGGKKSKSYKNFGIFSSHIGIEMANPMWGSKEDVGEILDNSDSVEDLIKQLKKIEK